MVAAAAAIARPRAPFTAAATARVGRRVVRVQAASTATVLPDSISKVSACGARRRRRRLPPPPAAGSTSPPASLRHRLPPCR